MSDSKGLEYPVPATVRLGEKDGQRALIYVFGPAEKHHRAQPRILESFRRLADADEQTILKFSQDHGVLTGWPELQSRPRNQSLPIFDELHDLLHSSEEGGLYDSLAVWRSHARRADAILRIAQAIMNSREPQDDDWKVLYGGVPPKAKTRRTEGKRRLLVDTVNGWLSLADLHPGLRWSDGEFEMTFRSRNLSGALGWLLIETIAGRHMKICLCCGEPFIPSPEHRKYCQKCPGAAHRFASKKYDQKMRYALRSDST